MADTTTVRSRGRDALDIEIVRVTPAIAKEWLGLNTHNRHLSQRAIARYAHDMTQDEWMFAGDPIRFNGNGALIDGQHRLHACILANKPFQALVIRNMPLTVQEHIDQGRARRASDHLSLRGFASAAMLAATARNLLFLKGSFGKNGPTTADVMRCVERHPRLVDSVEYCNTNRVLGITPSLLTAIHYIGAYLLDDHDRADAFANVFATGEPDYDGDPAHLWRERSLAEKRRSTRMTRAMRRIGSVYVWNAFRSRQPLSMLRIPDVAEIDGLDPDRI